MGGALIVVAGIFGLAGRARLRAVTSPVPERALQSVRDDISAVQEGVQAGRDDDGRGVSA